MQMKWIIGIDCATRPQRVGIALAELQHSRPCIVEAEMGTASGSIAERVAGWIGKTATALLAIDAPLGWPANLGRTLASHRAGEAVHELSDRLFLRETDHVIQRKLGKRPLEVGADRIARTAVAALSLLDDLRTRLDEPIPLAWGSSSTERVSAIEVYPAGTLRAHGLDAPGYKKPLAIETRRRLLERLSERLDIAEDRTVLESQVDVLDAVLCVLAGWDYLGGAALEPEDRALAEKEGWIWVRRPRSSGN